MCRSGPVGADFEPPISAFPVICAFPFPADVLIRAFAQPPKKMGSPFLAKCGKDQMEFHQIAGSFDDNELSLDFPKTLRKTGAVERTRTSDLSLTKGLDCRENGDFPWFFISAP